jgi:3-oxoacyl-[acyl-carrier protein] reductase
MHNVTINNILPGAFATETMNSRIAAMAKQSGKTVDEIAQQRLNSIPAGRFGNPLEFGQLCAYLCSEQASYITGQNFLIDGGAYPGTF